MFAFPTKIALLIQEQLFLLPGLFVAFETNSCFTTETAFFAEHSFQAVCLSTTFFLCNGVFFIMIANKKFASSDKGKKIALPDVAGIIVLLFFGSMGKGLLSMRTQSIRKTCRCPATRCCKKPELLGWDPPRPPESA